MRVGAIDNPDRFEDSFEPNYVQEVVEIIFTRSISKVRPHKPPKNRLFWHLVRLLLRFYAYKLYHRPKRRFWGSL